MDWKSLRAGDPALINKIVEEYMSQGKFDQLRRQLMSEVDTKPSYQNVKQRMETTVRAFLVKTRWRPDLSKNQLRDTLKRQILAAPFLRPGVKRIVDQLANRSAMIDLRPDLEDVTRDLLGIKDQPMDTQPDEAEVVDSPDEHKMVIVAEEQQEEPLKQELKPTPDELEVPGEKPYERLTVAMENLAIPTQDNFSAQPPAEDIPSPVIKSEPEPESEEPMLIDEAGEESDHSDHSIINQMSPISAGTPSPPPSPLPPLTAALMSAKRASDFVGKIPKLRKDVEKDVSDTKPDDRAKKDEKPKNGVSDDRKRRDRSRDRKSSRDSSRHSKSNDRKDDKRERSERSRTSSDQDRTRRRDTDKNRHSSRDRDKNRDRDRYSSRDKDRSRDSSYSSRDRERNRDKYRTSDRRREKSRKPEEKSKKPEDSTENASQHEVIEKSEHENMEKMQERKEDSEKKEEMEVVSENSPNVEEKVSIEATSQDKEVKSIEEESSEESVKTVDEGSQESQDSESGKPKITAKPPVKLSTMMTRSKGRKSSEEVNKSTEVAKKSTKEANKSSKEATNFSEEANKSTTEPVTSRRSSRERRKR